MKIRVTQQGKLITEYKVEKEEFLLGRSQTSDILINNESISRRHIVFHWLQGEEKIRFKKESKFSILNLNGVDTEQGEVSVGDAIEIGDILIQFVEDNTLFSSQQPEQPVHSIIGLEQQKPEPEPSSAPQPEEPNENLTLFNKESSTASKKKKTSEGNGSSVTNQDKTSSVIKESPSQAANSKLSSAGNPEATIVGPAKLIYQLIALGGPYKDKVFIIDKAEMIIGRQESSDITLVDELMSRKHAKLYRVGMDYHVVDMQSSNGIKVNGRRVTDPLPLSSGDVLEIGSNTLRFMVVNTLQQNIKGIDMEMLERQKPLEKVEQPISDTQIRKLEKAYGVEETVPPKKKPIVLYVALVAIIGVVVYFLAQDNKKPVAVQKVEEKKEAEPIVQEEVKNEALDPALAHLPIGVQRQLMAEYEVGVKLFKNFQYELSEDRARQILLKAPNWKKAQDLLELSQKAKADLLNQKKQQEDDQIKKMLEQKIAALLPLARAAMKNGDYDKVREIVAKILELDPNNEEAKGMLKKIEEMEEQKRVAAEKRAELTGIISNYESIFNKGKKYFENQEYRKAIETLRKCVGIPTLGSEKLKNIETESRKMINESGVLIQEKITPEISSADEMLTNGQYREAIAAYKRVLKIDYKNQNAKTGIVKAQKAIEENAKDYYTKGVISESVSDLKNACYHYNAVIDIAMPGSKYYKNAMDKIHNYCKKYEK